MELEHWQTVRRRASLRTGAEADAAVLGTCRIPGLMPISCLHLAGTCDVRMAGRYDEVDGRLTRQRGITLDRSRAL